MPRKHSYPDDDTLVAWASGVRWNGLAEKCGVSRGSLRDYLRIRPELKARVLEAFQPRLTPEQVDANNRAAQRRWRENNPDVVRAINRRWGRNQDPKKRAYWNRHNRARRAGQVISAESQTYADALYHEPCSYFDDHFGPPTVDHIIPLHAGGEEHWSNYAASCQRCNQRKQGRSLLKYLLATAKEYDRCQMQ